MGTLSACRAISNFHFSIFIFQFFVAALAPLKRERPGQALKIEN
jgi:hypothetical protein